MAGASATASARYGAGRVHQAKHWADLRLVQTVKRRLEITDILANVGGLYGGPKIERLQGVLERDGAAPVHFDAKRQMFMHFGLPRSTCDMVGAVTYGPGGDIASWLREPVDGAQLGDLS